MELPECQNNPSANYRCNNMKNSLYHDTSISIFIDIYCDVFKKETSQDLKNAAYYSDYLIVFGKEEN